MKRVLTEQQQLLLQQWFKVDKLSTRAALRRAQEQGWDIKRTALDTYRREILGVSSESASGQLRRAAADVGPGPEEDLDVAVAAAAAELGVELEGDDLAGLARQLKRVQQLGLETKDPQVAARALQVSMSVAKQLDALRLSRNPGRAPAALIYLPAEDPDPDTYDPNDPASWPDNPYARPPHTPDPATYPPDRPASWPNNPYGCPAARSA